LTERKVPVRISNAEIKAGIFLTLCLALFVSMLFVLGNFGRAWRGRQEINVVFTQVSALRPDAPVRYNGMNIGHVENVKIVRVDDALLARFPILTHRDLPNLPLSDQEQEVLRALREDKIDEAARNAIRGRTMVVLVLDLLREGDTQRFRMDDDYRINGSIMGDSAVDIRTGRGQIVPPVYDRLFLGISGDMYTDLGKSISQVKDILASMAEIVGGADTRQAIRGQVNDFDAFTARLEREAGDMQEKLPALWTGIDKQMDGAKVTMNDVEAKVAKMQPKLIDALQSAQKAVTETREGFAKSFDEIHDKVKRTRKEAAESTSELALTTAEYRTKLPDQLQKTREWTERVLPLGDKIDGFFTRAEAQLDKGLESTRAMLGGYTEQATNFEELTFRLKKWPSTFANKPTEQEAANQHAFWKRELARRQFQELRSELDALRQMLAGESPDKGRNARVEQLIRETDAAFDAGAPPESGKGKRR